MGILNQDWKLDIMYKNQNWLKDSTALADSDSGKAPHDG
jgi:hypothetical protein